ncbi:glycerophosphoryl diester phosphodiesterase membrane domain-containing protein [Staphylococcus schweitzeri]|uniref:glycerophosphoryl diester phosphodiesterase membrane domain-containing protein n=1 Tax=Staphylococcus schweitzeri TaxID=1654388 RepID=UPI0005086A14|nr:glycerophosphoryl diester phosphodiesterase membrane domain-containing protein [Staphylococcus schweitzeri]CDR22765.1 glycerophosphodiester phosphodiesterase [Staphylococcus schweitzeri]
MKRIITDIWTVFKLLYQNKGRFSINALLLQLIMIFISSTYLIVLFNLMLKVAGQSQLTINNWLEIVSHPASVILLIIFILSIAFLIYVEFSLLVYMVYAGFNRQIITFKSIFKNAFINVRKLIGVPVIFFIIYLILMIPIANLGLSSVLTKNIYIPKFLTEELMKTTKGIIFYSAFMIIIFILNFKLIFTLPLTILNRQSLFKNMKLSWQITKRNKFRLVIEFLILEFIISAILTIVVTGVTFMAIYLDEEGNKFLVSSILFVVLKSTLFFYYLFTKLSLISVLVLHLKQENVLYQPTLEFKDPKPKRKSKFFILTMILALVCFIGYNMYLFYNNSINQNISIIGHRGFEDKGVENSIPSLKAAAKANVEYVELDTIMTKDKQFVVSHDNNLKRLTGIDKNISESRFKDVVGLKMRQNGHEAKLVSLDEFIEQAKRANVKLLVELKPHGKEPADYTKRVIDILKKHGVEHDYRVMSLDYDVMTKIKKEAPYIKCGYIIPLQFGHFKETSLDFFVIEDFSYTPRLVNQAHLENKEVYTWTINGEEDLTKYLQTNVDGIITDDAALADHIKEAKKDETYFDRSIRILFE